MKRKILNGSIVAALVAAIAVFCVMLQIEENRLAQYERGIIYVAVKEIPKGQLVTRENCHEFMKACELDINCIPKTALISTEQIMDLVATGRIDEGTMLTEAMFEPLNEIILEMKEPVIAGVKAEDLHQMAGGILRAGDRVHIYSITEEKEENLVWENVYVQNVFDQNGIVIGNEDNRTAVQRINVYFENQEIEKFYSELAKGSLRVVKVCD